MSSSLQNMFFLSSLPSALCSLLCSLQQQQQQQRQQQQQQQQQQSLTSNPYSLISNLQSLKFELWALRRSEALSYKL